MLRLRTIVLALALLLVAPLLVALGAAAYVLWELPPSQGERVRGPHDLIGVLAQGSYVWVVPAGEEQVVLIDAGVDQDAEAVRAEVRDREILAVLLTHAHPEQISGLAGLPPDVPVYLHEADHGLLSGEEQPGGWLSGWYGLLPVPELAVEPRPVAHDERLELGEASFRAIHAPGHSPGSVVWVWEDVLFTGGALLASSPLQRPPPVLADDDEQAAESLEKLLRYDFDHVADAHTGIVSNARSDLHRFLGKKTEPPEIRLRGPDQPLPGDGPEIEQDGLYVESRIPEADGSRPALLVLDSGEEWVLSRTPAEAWSAYTGRRVTVRGRLRAPQASPGLPAGLVVDVEAIEPVEGPGRREPRAPAPQVVSGADALKGAASRFVRVRGEVQVLEPLASGATHGEGTLLLDDGTEALLAGPLTLPRQQPVELLARIHAGDGTLWIVASRACTQGEPCP